MNCSNKQFADVWVQLEDALRGEHNWGGEVAEVYLYLVQPRSPYLDKINEFPKPNNLFYTEYVERQREAVRTLYEICKIFAKKREARILWECFDEDCGDYATLHWNADDQWVMDKMEHRIHIKVKQKNMSKRMK